MVTCAVVSIGVTSLALFVIQVVAIATPNWAVIGVKNETVYIGLFKLCSESQCLSIYGTMDGNKGGIPESYRMFLFLHITGVICLLMGCVFNGFRYLRCLPDEKARSFTNTAAIMLGLASGSILAGVIWFIVMMKTVVELLETNLSTELKYGYSFYLAVVTSITSLIVAITICVFNRQLTAPPVITTSVTPPSPETVVVNSTTTNQAEPPYPMTNPAGIPQDDPAYGYDQ